MVLTIPILAHPLRLSRILRIALPLFSTPPRPIPTVHTHSSIPRLLIRHQCPHTPIGPLRTHHRGIARCIHQIHTLRLVRQNRIQLLARLPPRCITIPRILRCITRLYLSIRRLYLFIHLHCTPHLMLLRNIAAVWCMFLRRILPAHRICLRW